MWVYGFALSEQHHDCAVSLIEGSMLTWALGLIKNFNYESIYFYMFLFMLFSCETYL